MMGCVAGERRTCPCCGEDLLGFRYCHDCAEERCWRCNAFDVAMRQPGAASPVERLREAEKVIEELADERDELEATVRVLEDKVVWLQSQATSDGRRTLT